MIESKRNFLRYTFFTFMLWFISPLSIREKRACGKDEVVTIMEWRLTDGTICRRKFDLHETVLQMGQ